MTIKGTVVINKKIISKKDQQQLGSVIDIIYDPKKNVVAGLLMTDGDILTEAKVLPFKEIDDITSESIIAKSEKSIKPSSKAVKPITDSTGEDDVMEQSKVLNSEGVTIGTFRDIYFDSKKGKVSEYEVQKDDSTIIKVPVKKVQQSTEDKTIIDSQEKQEGIMKKLSDFMSK